MLSIYKGRRADSTPRGQVGGLVTTRWKKYLRAVLAGSLLFAAALAALLVGGVLPASAASLTVTDCSGSLSDTGSLPYAVANASSGDTIEFDAGLSCPPTSPIPLTSTIAISQDLTITGPGASTIAVSGGGTVGVFKVDSGTVTISGLTIENGAGTYGGGIGNDTGTLYVTDDTITGNTTNGSPNNGGGIDNGDNGGSGTVTVTGSTISDNTAGDGGAIDNADNGGSGTVTVTGSTISGNTASVGGGGIGNGNNGGNGTVTVTNSTVSGNTAVVGGGIANGRAGGGGTVTVTNSTMSDNTGGGGIDNAYNGGGIVTVTNSTISGNTASGSNGGGIDNGDNGGSGTVTVTDCTISDNTAGDGGAIDNADNGGGGTVTVTGSTISGNTASVGGGGIGNGNNGGNGGTVTVTGSTISGNMAIVGGGIDNGHAGGGGTVTVTNSTISGNTASGNNGGGIDNADNGGGTVTVTGSTISGNTAGDGGGIDNGDNGGKGTITVTVSTIAGNTAGDGGGIDNADDGGGGSVTLAATIVAGNNVGGDCYVPVTDAGYNIADDDTCGFSVFDSINNSGGLKATLGTLANNGGATDTILPTASSPAVGAIPASPATILNGVQVCPRTDQRGGQYWHLRHRGGAGGERLPDHDYFAAECQTGRGLRPGRFDHPGIGGGCHPQVDRFRTSARVQAFHGRSAVGETKCEVGSNNVPRHGPGDRDCHQPQW